MCCVVVLCCGKKKLAGGRNRSSKYPHTSFLSYMHNTFKLSCSIIAFCAIIAVTYLLTFFPPALGDLEDAWSPTPSICDISHKNSYYDCGPQGLDIAHLPHPLCVVWEGHPPIPPPQHARTPAMGRAVAPPKQKIHTHSVTTTACAHTLIITTQHQTHTH